MRVSQINKNSSLRPHQIAMFFTFRSPYNHVKASLVTAKCILCRLTSYTWHYYYSLFVLSPFRIQTDRPQHDRDTGMLAPGLHSRWRPASASERLHYGGLGHRSRPSDPRLRSFSPTIRRNGPPRPAAHTGDIILTSFVQESVVYAL